MSPLYLLIHRHNMDGSPVAEADFTEAGEPVFWDDREEDFKVLGIYSSRAAAEERIPGYREMPGFRLYPDGFFVHEYLVDQDHWLSGFTV